MDTNEHIEQIGNAEAGHPNDDKRATGIGMAAWVGSAVTHATALALMGAIYWTVTTDEQVIEYAPVKTNMQTERIKPTPPVDKPKFSDNQSFLPDVVADDTKMASMPDLPDIKDPGEDEAPPELPPAVRGDVSANADAEMGAVGPFVAIGVGANAKGKLGVRYPGRGKAGGGPSRAPQFTIKSTASALRWFKRHQSPNGMWDADNYFANCIEAGPKGEPGKDQSGDTDVAMTAYAVLCFLGDGYDHVSPGIYRPVVRKGIDWLLAAQKPDGLLGQRNYEHAIATMVLAQAYAMSNDPKLREPTQRAVDIILARQNRDPAATAPYDRLGWDYVNASGRNDASVTGWNVMALKSAMVAGLKVDEGINGCKAWLEKSWVAANTGKPWCASTKDLDPYKGISRFGYTWKTGSNDVEISAWNAAGNRPESIANHDLAPVGLLSAVFLGHQQGEAMLESLANYVAQYHMPTAWPCNTYYLYYNTLGMFQVGGPRWQAWAKTVLPMLHAAQRTDEGCMEGSWDWQGTQFHGSDTGRVLSTAYACLSMQVYWIYEKAESEKKKAAK